MEIRVVDGLDEGKLVKGGLNPCAPKLDELEGDEVFESDEDGFSKFEEDELDEGLGGSIDSIITQWAGDITQQGIPNGGRP